MNERHSSAKQRLLDAALGHFARDGFSGASIRGITRELGLRESAFYAHFESKQAAYDELFAEAGPAVVSRLVAHIPPDQLPGAVLKKLAKEIMKAWTTPRARALSNIFVREALGGHGAKRQTLIKAVDSSLDALERQFKMWQRSGHIAGDLSPRMLAFEFVTPLVSTRLLYYNALASEEDGKRGAQLVTRHVANFIKLIRVD